MFFFPENGPRFLSNCQLFFSMTSKQREDAENGKFKRFKLFIINLILIIGKIGETQVLYVFNR